MIEGVPLVRAFLDAKAPRRRDAQRKEEGACQALRVLAPPRLGVETVGWHATPFTKWGGVACHSQVPSAGAPRPSRRQPWQTVFTVIQL